MVRTGKPSPTQWPPFARRLSTSFFMTVLSRTVLGEPGRLGFVASSTLLCSAIYLEQVRSLRIPYIGTQTPDARTRHQDRKSVVSGKSVSVRVYLGGRLIIKK